MRSCLWALWLWISSWHQGSVTEEHQVVVALDLARRPYLSGYWSRLDKQAVYCLEP